MIHKYTLNGFHIVLDTNSGAVHLFDDAPFAMLDYLDGEVPKQPPQQMMEALKTTYDETTLKEAYDEIKELYEIGQLYSQDGYHNFADMLKEAPIKSMCLNVAHDCNLRCAYCFAAKGDFGCGRKLMPLEVGKKAIDFLIANSKERRNLELDFFGGEPLMNFEVVKQIVAYAKDQAKKHEKQFRFTLTTNGVLLTDDVIAYLNQEMYNVVLSLDGRKEINDRLRVRTDGTGSYDSIVPNYKKLVQTRGGKDYYVRGTFTKYNLDFAKDAEHMAELGFDQVSVEPVVSDPKLPYALQQEDLPAVFAEYENLADLLIDRKKAGKGFQFFHFLIDLDQGPCAIKRLRGCGCGNEYVCITPQGDIFPCHQFVGDDKWKMGNIMDDTFDMPMKQEFARSNVYSKEDCKDCWAKFYCSGGCAANSWQYEGDILKSHALSCQLEKKRLECAIMIKAAMAQ